MAYDTPYTLKELTGSLFKNNYKQNNAQPNLRGTALIDGKEYEVAGWTKPTRNGEKWISMVYKSKDESAKPVAKSAPAKQTEPDFDDDMPF